MPDFDAIAAAIALRYAPAQVTPPGGLENVAVSTADLPNALTELPAALTFLDSGTFDPGHGTRLGEATFLERFYFNETTDLAADMAALRKWLTILVDQHKLAMQLGGIVAAVRTRAWKIGVMDYAGHTFTGIELRLQVVTTEPWSPSS